MEGYGPSQIANILEEDKILVPSAHYKSLGISYPAPVPENPYAWQSRTVADLLSHQEYLGHTVNFKTYKKDLQFCISHIFKGIFQKELRQTYSSG